MILFQLDRRSGVRGTIERAADGSLTITAANCHGGVMRAKRLPITREAADRFVAEAREKNGDGDVEIIVDTY